MEMDTDDSRIILRVRDPSYYESRIQANRLGVNRQSGELEVSESFFKQVWNEAYEDDSWKAWVCISEGEVIGVIVVQVQSFSNTWNSSDRPLFMIRDTFDGDPH
jgi:hypothetical protein